MIKTAKLFTVKELKEILQDCKDDTLVLIKASTDDMFEEINSIHGLEGYDYVHTTAKSNNIVDIDACAMSCICDRANIVYLYYKPKKND